MREWRLVQEIALGAGTAGWIRTTDLLIHSRRSRPNDTSQIRTSHSHDASSFVDIINTVRHRY
jgi:hypothetical protein